MQTGSTIARIAARPATSTWSIAVVSENTRVLLKLDWDPGLVPAVGGAVAHFAEHAGFDAPTRDALIAAAEGACRGTLKLHKANAGELSVNIEGFPDRLEICLEHHGLTAPAAGPQAFAVPGAEASTLSGLSGLGPLSRVDRVLYNTQGSTSRVTLVQYLHAKPDKSQ